MSAQSAREEQDIRIVLEREFKATPQAVWQAWTQADALSRWFGPPNVKAVSASADVRVGGAYEIIMQSAAGETHHVKGRYTEVVADQRLGFTWAWITTPELESHVTVELAATAAGTRLTLIHARFADEAAAASHREGWLGCFDNLATALA